MRLSTLSTALSVLAAAGCASSESSSSDPNKQDRDGVSLEELTSGELEAMFRYASVEHVTDAWIESGTGANAYHQQVRVYCTQTGGHVAPIECFLAVLPMPEVGGAYKVFKLGGNLRSEPEVVDIAITGSKATVKYAAGSAVATDDDIVTEHQRITATVTLSGSGDDPKVDVAVACAKQDGAGACGGFTGVTDVTNEEASGASSVEFVTYKYISTGDETTEGYSQQVKLLCHRGSHDIAPMDCFVAVLPIEELDGAYKIYRLTEALMGDPYNASVDIDGAAAKIAFSGRIPHEDGDKLGSQEVRYTVDLSLSGAVEDPTVATSLDRAAGAITIE